MDKKKRAELLAKQRMEGVRGGAAGAKEVPSFDDWPLYEASVEEMPGLEPDELEAGNYKVLGFQKDYLKGAILLNSWVAANKYRSLGFKETGSGRLSTTKVTLPILMNALLRLEGLLKFREASDSEEQATVDEYRATEVEQYESTGRTWGLEQEDEFTVLRQVLTTPKGENIDDVKVDGIVGRTGEGSAVAIWVYEEEQRIARIDLCLGHDCLTTGPLAEEKLLKLVRDRAAELGADKLRCRVRYTEDGYLFPFPYLATLKLKPLFEFGEEYAYDQSEEEYGSIGRHDALTMEGLKILIKQEELAKTEVVSELHLWLNLQNLERVLPKANEWCKEMGAVDIQEVIDNREDLADYLGDDLDASERERMLGRRY